MRHFTIVLLFACAFWCCQKPLASKSITTTPTDSFVRGADISWLTEMEAASVKFYDSLQQPQNLLPLLKNYGINTIRLRVWVNPLNGWNGLSDVLTKAIRAKNAGMRLLIDFHYSDTWADPAHQTSPANWQSLPLSLLCDSLAQHTKHVLNALKTNNIYPEWIQIGNETNNGMLWPMGQASTNMAGFAQLFKAGYQAAKQVFPEALVMVHLSNGWDNALYSWLLNGLKSNGAVWDVVGMSLYPSVDNWQTLNHQCLSNMQYVIQQFQTPVMLAEVGMPWDAPDAAYSFLKDIIQKTKSLPNKKGLGVAYWEPQAYRQWQGYTLGCFDNTGKPTKAFTAFMP